MYGLIDDIIALKKELGKSIDLLVAVATGEKGVDEVKAWLEENYPERCVEIKKKW